MRNIVEVIYIDDNGLDHHVRAGSLTPYKAHSPAQAHEVEQELHELAEKMGKYLRKQGKEG